MSTPDNREKASLPNSVDFRRRAEQMLEAAAVIKLLSVLGLSKYRSRLLQHGERLGQQHLSFDAVYCEFPHFPVYLRAVGVTNLASSLNVGALLTGRFENSVLRTSLLDWQETASRPLGTDCLGVVFKWPHTPELLVLHDSPGRAKQCDNFISLAGGEMFINSYVSLLRTIKWHPDQD